MPKTANYTRKAIDDYRRRNDFINLKFPKGTKERMLELGISNNNLVEECLNFIAGIEEIINSEELTGEPNQEPVEGALTTQISPAKEKYREIINAPAKDGNKANKEPFDIYAAQAELDAKREEVKVYRESAEPEEIPESVEDTLAQQEAEESDELADKLKAIKAYRKQVVEEREKYGELQDESIKRFVNDALNEGEDITTPEYQERIREAIGTVNMDRINEYMKSIGMM